MLQAERSAWLWAALPLAAILAIDPSGLAPFGPAKWALVPALVLAATALSTTRASVGWALPAFVAWTGVTALFGLDRVYAWTGTPERHFGVVAWVLVLLAWHGGRSLSDPGRRLVLVATTATAAIVGAWAGAEALGWEPLHLVGIGDRPVGPLGSSAFLGAAAVLVTPVSIGWAASQTERSKQIAGAIAGAAGLAALAASGARAALFAAGALAVLTVVVRRGRVLTAVVAGCVVLVVAVALATGAAGRVSAVASDRDGGAHGRLDEWRVAIRVVGAHPVLGTGPEGYRIAFGKAVDDRYERDHGRNPLPDRAHSAVLDVAATTGLVGLVLYAIAIGAAMWAAFKALRGDSPLLAGAAVGVLAYFAQSLFLFPIAELEPVAWLLAGLVATQTPRTGRTSYRNPASDTPSSPKKVVAGALAVTALVAGVLDMTADRQAKRVLEAVADDKPTSTRAAALRPDQVRYRLIDARAHEAIGSSRGLTNALSDIQAALHVSPNDPIARAEKGRLLLALARLHEDNATLVATARAYLDALAVDDPRNAEVLLRLGLARDLAGDQPGAITAWKRAEYLAPRTGAASSNLAVAYAKAGKTTEARAAAKRALTRDPTNAPAQAVLDSLDHDGT